MHNNIIGNEFQIVLIYDTCAYKKRLDESVGPLNYTLYPGKYENCSKCRIELGVVGGKIMLVYLVAT